MHRLALRFGATLVGILAFLGVFGELNAPLGIFFLNSALGTVVAFLIGGGVGFIIVLAGFYYLPTLKKS